MRVQCAAVGASQHGFVNLNYVTANAGGSASSSTKLATTATGVTVTGAVTATSFAGDGSALTGLGGGLPSGAIILWSGAVNAIPTGYVLCNGQNSTPNLIDRFVVGAGSVYAVGATGGAATHTLTEAEMPAHVHHFLIQNGSNVPMGYAQSANGTNIGWAGTNSKGSSAAHNNLPPYYALCYIMKT